MASDRSWLQRIGLSSTSEWSQRVYLNVGGTAFTTTRQSFRQCEGSPLFGPILRGQAARDEDGNVFLDLDGALFRHILNFLRSGVLALPDDFSEWAQLEQEVAHCQLPELSAALAATYEFQRYQFRRELPPAVCISWPRTVVVLEGETDLARRLHGGGGAAAAASSSPSLPPPSPTRLPGSAASTHSDRTGEPKSRIAQITEQMHRSVASVLIAPPLPALRVSEGGSTVIYNEDTVLYNLDQLISVLLCVYEYKVQHWAEREGRVFLSL